MCKYFTYIIIYFAKILLNIVYTQHQSHNKKNILPYQYTERIITPYQNVNVSLHHTVMTFSNKNMI